MQKVFFSVMFVYVFTSSGISLNKYTFVLLNSDSDWLLEFFLLISSAQSLNSMLLHFFL